MFATTLGLALLAPASPVPDGQPAGKVGAVERSQAVNFAHIVLQLAARIQDDYTAQVEVPDLLVGAVRELYAEAGATPPDELIDAVTSSRGYTEQLNLLVEARMKLGDHPALRGPRSLFAAIDGFRRALDPGCVLMTRRVQSFSSIECDFGIGIELEGATGPRWAMYQYEYATAVRWTAPTGWFGPVPKRDEVPPPTAIPWRVKRVIPGSPAQKAGVQPGDAITHFNGTAIAAENAPRLFAEFAFPPGSGLDTPPVLGVKRKLQLSRPGSPQPLDFELVSKAYVPESVFGARRRQDGTWDAMLDRENKIGYIRIGALEQGAELRVEELLVDLNARGCRALILDLRWCPGGYVTTAQHVLGLFLPQLSLIAKLEYRNPDHAFGASPELRTLGTPRFLKTPIVLLVGSETTGGGELLGAALQDHNRVVTMGQRTVGRAFIQTTTEAGFGNLMFKVSTGTSFRPNGKPRQRLTTSQPTDSWGVKPDAGLEVPVTADLMAELRRDAEMHSIRPWESDDALPFDDPAKDPFRLAALAYLRKRLK